MYNEKNIEDTKYRHFRHCNRPARPTFKGLKFRARVDERDTIQNRYQIIRYILRNTKQVESDILAIAYRMPDAFHFLTFGPYNTTRLA